MIARLVRVALSEEGRRGTQVVSAKLRYEKCLGELPICFIVQF